MKTLKQEQKIKPELKIADDFLDIQSMNTVLVEQLEESIRMREMSIEKQFKFLAKKQRL